MPGVYSRLVTDLPEQPPSTAVDEAREIVDGDAATHLEALVFADLVAGPGQPVTDGLAIELVGQHLRLSGTVQIGFHRRLSDFVNNHEGLIRLHDATVLRRNGDPTKVTAPSLWVTPEEVTLVGQSADRSKPDTSPKWYMDKKAYTLIVVTSGHTLSGQVHLNPEAVLSAFIESPSPVWIPMTDVRTRSLADRRVTSRYDFALLNRRHIVAATEMLPGMTADRAIL